MISACAKTCLLISAAVAALGYAEPLPIQFAQLRIPGIITALKKPKCTEGSSVSARLSSFHEAEIGAGESAVPYVHLVTAGSYLAFEVPPTPATINIYAKIAGDNVFHPVCLGVKVQSYSSKGAIEAIDPALGAGSIWRVEMFLEPVTTVGPPVRIAFYREPEAARDPDQSVDEALNDAEGFLCVGVVGDQPKRRRQKGFGGKVSLEVDSRQNPPLSGGQQAALDDTILLAVGLWVQACEFCRVDHLAAVTINGVMYLRQGLASFLTTDINEVASDPKAMNGRLDAALEPLEILAAGGPPAIPRTKELTSYVRVSPSGQELVHFCALSSNSVDAPTLSSVQLAVCSSKQLPKDARASIRIRFRDGRTGCGDSLDTIACRADMELTEYNARDFQFDFVNGSSPPIGTGHIHLSLLHAMLHEMGHWIGLNHIKEGESIMAESLSRSRCIDAHTIQLLAVGSQEVAHWPTAFRLNE